MEGFIRFITDPQNLLSIGVGVLVFAAEPRWWLAGIAGVIVGSLWNYCASTLLVWRNK